MYAKIKWVYMNVDISKYCIRSTLCMCKCLHVLPWPFPTLPPPTCRDLAISTAMWPNLHIFSSRILLYESRRSVFMRLHANSDHMRLTNLWFYGNKRQGRAPKRGSPFSCRHSRIRYFFLELERLEIWFQNFVYSSAQPSWWELLVPLSLFLHRLWILHIIIWIPNITRTFMLTCAYTHIYIYIYGIIYICVCVYVKRPTLPNGQWQMSPHRWDGHWLPQVQRGK